MTDTSHFTPVKLLKKPNNRLAQIASIIGIGALIIGPLLGIPTICLAIIAFVQIVKRKERGILFVIAALLFGIISFVFVFMPSSSREKARDAERRSDLAQIQTALHLYYDSHNSTYPSTEKIGSPDMSMDNDNKGSIGSTFSLLLLSDSRSVVLPQAGPTADNKFYDHYYYLEDRLSISDSPQHFVVFTQLEGSKKSVYYAINDEGSIWEQKETNAPTCVQGRSPVCGY